ncbi:MAG: glycosyltransferase, partial [Elusimicrobiota bacterium]
MSSDKGRIAILCASLGGGGAEKAMVNLASGLAERGHPVDLVLVQAEGPFLADVPPAVRIVDLRARRAAASIPALVRYLRRERPRVLLSALERVNVLAIAARWLSRVPVRVIVSVHAPLTYLFEMQKTLVGRIMRSLVLLSYPKADMVVSVSSGVQRDLLGLLRLPADRVRTIYNPIIDPSIQRLGQEDASHPWFAPGQPPVLLAVGRLSAEKDYPTLLRAFQRVRRQRPARLMILGEGEE